MPAFAKAGMRGHGVSAVAKISCVHFEAILVFSKRAFPGIAKAPFFRTFPINATALGSWKRGIFGWQACGGEFSTCRCHQLAS